MECHATEKPKVSASATFGDGHDSCATCHQAHAFSASSALRCTSCHEGTQVLAQNRAREHRDCSSCHKPHAVRAAGDQTCKGCHDDVPTTHHAQGEGDCLGCHDPHPKRRAQVAAQCSQCHDEARSERAFHAGKIPCTACHQPHRFDLSRLTDRALCGRCHVLQIRLTRRNLGHSSCEACHEGTTHEPGGIVDLWQLSRRATLQESERTSGVRDLSRASWRHGVGANQLQQLSQSRRAAWASSHSGPAAERRPHGMHRPATAFTKPRYAPIAQPA